MVGRLSRVSEAARELEISESWLRRAERRGRIRRARRDLNGWRAYTKEDIEALREVLLPSLADADEVPRSVVARLALENAGRVDINPRVKEPEHS